MGILHLRNEAGRWTLGLVRCQTWGSPCVLEGFTSSSTGIAGSCEQVGETMVSSRRVNTEDWPTFSGATKFREPDFRFPRKTDNVKDCTPQGRHCFLSILQGWEGNCPRGSKLNWAVPEPPKHYLVFENTIYKRHQLNLNFTNLTSPTLKECLHLLKNAFLSWRKISQEDKLQSGRETLSSFGLFRCRSVFPL